MMYTMIGGIFGVLGPAELFDRNRHDFCQTVPSLHPGD
jgi:hypothetical protein